MKVIYFLIVFSIVSLTLNSCRKDEFVDARIIEPLSYFPAYPGSFWIYDNGDTMKVSDAYESSGSVEYSQNGVETILFFPKVLANQTFSNTDIYINEYRYDGNSTWEFLSLTEGDQFPISNYSQGHQRFRKTIKVDTSITVGTAVYPNVIIVTEFESSCGYGEDCYIFKDYFAKDVGLIKREHKNWQDSLFYSTFEIENYFINK